MKLTSEVLQGVRAIKSYNWEQPFVQTLAAIRKAELDALKKSANAKAMLTAILSASPSFVAVATLSVYALLGHKLTPTKVFTALALFNQLRFPLIFFPMLLNTLAEGKVSLVRITDFLSSKEVDDYVERDVAGEGCAIAVTNATFSWKPKSGQIAPPDDKSTVTRGNLVGINFRVKKGELLAVVGPVGSGKSSLVSAVLGDMHLVGEGGRVVVQGSVALVPQTAWIPNESFRDVVLFGRPMNEYRYGRALHACGLEKDLAMLDSGDLTEIGERGTNLSGGQKQRLSIARAVYEDADIYLFDDPLSALDAEVGNTLFNECICEALAGKTRVLITHQLSVLTQVDRVVIMQQTRSGACAVLDQGTLPELLSRGHDFSELIKESAPNGAATVVTNSDSDSASDSVISVDSAAAPTVIESIDLNSEESLEERVMLMPEPRLTASPISQASMSAPIESPDEDSGTTSTRSDGTVAKIPAVAPPPAPVSTQTTTNTGGSAVTVSPTPATIVPASPRRLVLAEDRAEGAVKWGVYAEYLRSAQRPVLLAVIVASFLLANTCQVAQQWAVAAWTGDAGYTRYPLAAYLSAVAGMATGVAGFTWVRAYCSTWFGAFASERIHNNMVAAVLSAPLNYFGKKSFCYV